MPGAPSNGSTWAEPGLGRIRPVEQWNSTTTIPNAKRSPNSPFGDSALLSTAAYSRDKTTGYFGNDLPILELGLNDPLSPDDMIVTGSVFANNVFKDGHQPDDCLGHLRS